MPLGAGQVDDREELERVRITHGDERACIALLIGAAEVEDTPGPRQQPDEVASRLVQRPHDVAVRHVEAQLHRRQHLVEYTVGIERTRLEHGEVVRQPGRLGVAAQA